jgi:phosphonate transport system substrate-binding protein
LQNKTLATGARDSPQATLLPLHHLRQQGLRPDRDFSVRKFDLLVGKHGDHIGGELEALHSLQDRHSDACAMLDLNWTRWQSDGTIDPAAFTRLTTTAPFDHCNFTVVSSFPRQAQEQWTNVLFGMRYEDPRHRAVMDMEGLTAWLPGRTEGYADLTEAVEEQRFFERVFEPNA